MLGEFTTKGSRILLLLFAISSLSFFASSASAQYEAERLVANTPALHPRQVDPHLIDGWGVAFFPTGPFWVSDQNTSTSTLYTSDGTIVPLVVQIPCIANGAATVPCPLPGQGFSFPSAAFGPTGIVANSFALLGDFPISQSGTAAPAFFIFDTLDGLIAGWNPSVNVTQAVVAVDRSSAGVFYTGLTLAGPASDPHIYAANGAGGIDVFDKNFALVNSFAADSNPAPFTPYGIETIHDRLFVTYAGPPPPFGGILDVCDLSISTTNPPCRRLSESGPSPSPSGVVLNGPWGVALAPSDFGPLSNRLLVGNVTDGRINAFDPRSGAFVGPLRLRDGRPFAVLGLWDLVFGGGMEPVNGRTNQLFFTAGPGPTPAQIFSEGVFGVITPPHPR